MEPKDYEDLYKMVYDSDYLRQMSVMNANIAIQQAKWDLDKAITDYQIDMITKRINGGSQPVLDRLKEEFEKKSLLTIENYDKLVNCAMQVGEEKWKVVDVKETNTTYYFVIKRMDVFFNNEVKIGLNRVPMGGERTKLYNLFNDTNGNWVGIGKNFIKSKDEFIKKLIELTNEPV